MPQNAKVNNQNSVNSHDLLFITTVSIRKKIISSLETISGLYLLEQKGTFPPALSEEIRRTIILYSASIIEAVFLYLYKKRNFIIEKTDYSEVHTLPANFQSGQTGTLVLARQIKIKKNERELMLDVLLKTFKDKGIVTRSQELKIKKTKDVRNTFHLHKSRTGIQCNISTVNTSFDAIYEAIIGVKNYLNQNP